MEDKQEKKKSFIPDTSLFFLPPQKTQNVFTVIQALSFRTETQGKRKPSLTWPQKEVLLTVSHEIIFSVVLKIQIHNLRSHSLPI